MGYTFKRIVCVFFLSLLLLQMPAISLRTRAQEPETVSVPIIMYHSLLNKNTNQWNISPEAFEKDLQYLSENGYNTVFISDLIDYVYNGRPLPEKPVVLTFDDGYYNNYVKGMPLLEKYDMKIELSVIGANTDLWTEHADEHDERYGHLTWPQISEMVASGRVELANHTQNLHKNNNGRNGCCRKNSEELPAYELLLTEDVEVLQARMEDICGIRPECFTYPFGSKCPDAEDILKKLGFKATLSSTAGINRLRVGDPDCLYCMKRSNRTPNTTVKAILEKLEAST